MAHTERTTTKMEKEVFEFLNILKAKDMIGGIGVSTLKNKWPHLTLQEGIDLIGWWDQNYDPEGDYNMITV